MAEEQFQEKTEQATPKRRQEARDKGQVPRSRELTTMAVTLMAAISLMIFSGSMGQGLVKLFQSGLDLSQYFVSGTPDIIDPKLMFRALGGSVIHSFWILAPYLLVMLITATLAPLALGGWSFSVKAMAFKPDKLNPISGLKRLFALRGLVELLKALAKFLLIAGVGAVCLYWLGPAFIDLGMKPVPVGLQDAATLCGWFFVILSSSLIVIAAVDVPFQIWDHGKQLRMTKQEVKEEAKETEVNPELKGRIRAIQQQMANGRMLRDIPTADVIITNPTHYAVALKYDDQKMAAPVVVAKGIDHMAFKIREIGQEHSVLVFEAPPLARVLYASTKIGKEIPTELYVAVAQVLIYVHQLRTYKKQGGNFPEKPEIDEAMLKETKS